MTAPSSATATSSGTAPSGDKPKGSRPSHRIFRSAETDGVKSVQEIGALWPHKDGKGFSIKLKTAVQPGDDLMIRAPKGGF